MRETGGAKGGDKGGRGVESRMPLARGSQRCASGHRFIFVNKLGRPSASDNIVLSRETSTVLVIAHDRYSDTNNKLPARFVIDFGQAEGSGADIRPPGHRQKKLTNPAFTCCAGKQT
jgi:hypothetical protein